MATRSHAKDPQRNSTELGHVEQLALSLPGWVPRRERQLLPFRIEEVRNLPHEGAAIDLCMRCGGYQQEELAADLQVDKGTFSKVLSGTAQLPWKKLCLMMDLCRNEIPLIWRIETRGYDFSTLRRHFTDLERENFDLKQKLAKRDEQLEFAARLIAGKVSAT